ncbi:7-carboxy-7-deazaguanine synthase [Natranaerovirga pectinivora]|uniref:7-carboxy-7-deazaguanine synthase n=1 Tax=Natranaerovirga pectinivora TaxID=682400 RepID=A0A4R3MQG3_9FIRM|nr:putative 7-carboxy-7-deazaguanine synthase QueE [Natranaerovirga pectinivora]TCT15411.1 7-carboxy-7-deazaguanine synthase [Natranaerovirga pectinivora]
MSYKVVETFVSINGEGRKAGQLAVFIRLAGCNLECSYCDTMWANNTDVKYTEMSSEDIYSYIKSTNIKNITITGGEPLLQDNIIDLLNLLSSDNELSVEIETNGSVPLEPFHKGMDRPPSFTMDYKLGSSKMEGHMELDNLQFLTKYDTLKFVVGNLEDLERARGLINDYDLTNKTNIFLSPVFNVINYEDIVEYMKANHLNDVSLQLQLHKIIWNPDERGV